MNREPTRGIGPHGSSNLRDSGNLENILHLLRPLFPEPPQGALILGSGLGDFARRLSNNQRISTKNIPGYPRSTVPGHAGAIISGELAGKRLVCFQGRIHLYEGYPVDTVVFPIQVAAALGARILILTNASGGIHRHLEPGSLMLIEDQVDLQFQRTVIGARRALPLPLGRLRHFAEGSPYSPRLLKIAEDAARQKQIKLHRGVLGALSGPSYETPAEVRMWQLIGVDAACMSTAAEAAEGAGLGMEVLGLSCITNRAAGLSGKPLDHAEVIEVANQVKRPFAKLLTEFIRTYDV